ncbi:MAG TPA: aminopeptidase P N-terminal domain-containing protein [Enhygromyxa sp.]|nr:aminopeptidase P N-terminal domain-containing protein [Enhygromyxa sp.]
MAARPRPSLEAYAQRRARVAHTLREQSAALILYGGALATRANDTEFRFRPDSDFHYLTGLEEPGAVLVLRPTPDSADGIDFTMFVRPRDREAEVWSGRRIGPLGAVERFGASEAFDLDELDERLPKLIDGCETVYLPLGRWPELDTALLRAVAKLRRRNREGATPPFRYGEVADLLGEERLIKDPAALDSLRHAIDISAAGHVAAMRRTRPGMWEYEVEALIEYEFRRRGSSGPGYGSIVGGGDNATILHYVDNRDRLRDGDILLIDAGAEWDYFSGDITRSWPVNGRFRPEQRAVYEVVLAANLAGIRQAVVGSSIDVIHEACVDVLCEGIADLGLLQGPPARIREEKLYRKFYMHRTSHWLGVDVHDVGRYTLGGNPRPLAPGCVLTIEPGLYIAADSEDVPDGFRGIGVRIEDDVLIGAEGPEVLTAAVPKSIAELEAIIGVV